MQHQPAPCDGYLQAGAVLRGRAHVAEQEWTIDPLDINPAILNGFEGASVLQQSARALLTVAVGRSASVSKAEVSRFPVLGEWHGAADSVMPVRNDVHRTSGTTLLAHDAAADRRPRQIPRQGVEPDVDHASIAFTARTLDVAGYETVRAPFRRGAKRVISRSIVSVVAARPSEMIPRPTK